MGGWKERFWGGETVQEIEEERSCFHSNCAHWPFEDVQTSRGGDTASSDR